VLQSTDAELLGFGEGEEDDSDMEDEDDDSDDEQPAAAAKGARTVWVYWGGGDSMGAVTLAAPRAEGDNDQIA
jgi:hypothetical protein